MTNDEIITLLEDYVGNYTGKFGYVKSERRIADDGGKGSLIDPSGLVKILNAVKKNMNNHVWYCVTSSFDNNGRYCGSITATRRCLQKPLPSRSFGKRKDIYTDWFVSKEEALAFIEEGKKA